MDRINAEQFRANMKEWMEAARNEPVKITRKSGEAFEKMQLDLARLQGITASLADVDQVRAYAGAEKPMVFEPAKKRALSCKNNKKVVG